ncbi:N-acetyltransferase [Sinomonas cyclohexanicum]|uniref:N-acetyltransferase n=1 Tax=Sinomonas cyclohexanicum TaxID=322009 RepID=A0ABN6FHK0_SINCY|nr:GNAT family protein [Corynebacterium cyclohexanicum]BCT75835.1 N-acetyltransferase [Corynebacterium cyclohexanicum]
MHHELTLAGHGVRLLPLSPLYAEQLFSHIDASLWSGMAARRPDSVEDLAALFAARLEDPATMPFAAADDASGALVGTTGLYDVDLGHGRAEVGGTFFARPYWGSGANPASKYLLLSHAFEEMGLSRISFRVDTRNGRSAKALLTMGAVYEGTLRGYRPGHDGARVDTAVFSVLEPEWPMVRGRLLSRLAPRSPGDLAPVDAA